MYDIDMLCMPAWLYLMFSGLMYVLVAVQNLLSYSAEMYHVGHVKCRVPHVFMVFLLKALFIIFWTWILDMICKSGHPDISWVLLLFPLIVLVYALSTALMVGLAVTK